MPPTSPFFSRLSDIRIWIGVFFLIRLVGITNPPLETSHNWRQSLTNMIARNFYEGRANIFYPEIDYAGSNYGIIGSEFPFFNYLIYLVASITDFTHWHGRLINLIVSSLGVYFFYRLLRELTKPRIAFNASIILLSSIWFAFSRKIMPDTFSISLVIMGLYFCHRYLVKGTNSNLILYFVLTTLGVLCKIPGLSLVAVLAVLFYTKDIPKERRENVGILTVFSVGLVSLWYFYWVPHLVETYQNQLYFPRGLVEGFKEILPYTSDFLRNFYFNALHSYIAFALCLAGLYLLFVGTNRVLKIGILAISFTFFLFILKTGIVFPLHNYYIIPFVPVMAIFAGIALERLKGVFQSIILVLIALEGILNQQHDFFIKDSEAYILKVEDIAARNTMPGDRIVINGGQSPQEIYFAHRKGWSVTNDKIDSATIQLYKEAGAAYLIINNRTYSPEIDFIPAKERLIEYSIYRIKDE